MRNRTYGGVRGRKTKVGRKLLRFPPTRFNMGKCKNNRVKISYFKNKYVLLQSKGII